MTVTMRSPSHESTWTAKAKERLVRALGAQAGQRVADEALARIGATELRTPDELLAFANHLVTQGGVIEAVGRALKVSALLRGAVERKAS
jgi:hypothetical protein